MKAASPVEGLVNKKRHYRATSHTDHAIILHIWM